MDKKSSYKLSTIITGSLLIILINSGIIYAMIRLFSPSNRALTIILISYSTILLLCIIALIIYAYRQTKLLEEQSSIDETKSEFVNLASHQLRTPLTAVKWYAELLLTGGMGDLNQNQKEYMQELFHASERMTELIDAFLNVSRIEMGTFSIAPKPLNIVAVVQNELNEIMPQIEDKKFKFKEVYDPDIPNINLDHNLTQIIVQNLLTNAVKYTKQGGTITIQIKKNPEDKDTIIFSVQDTGYGIPKKQQNKIFSKLFRADNVKQLDTQGTGLGLFTVQSILNKTGGKIWFESEENKGSTFYVALPLSGMPQKITGKQLQPQAYPFN